MKEMRDFFEELLRGEPVAEVIARNKMQVAKLALVLVAAVSVCFLYMYRSGGDLPISETGAADAPVTATAEDPLSGSGDPAGNAGNAAGGNSADGDQAGDITMGTAETRALDTDGVLYVDIGGAVRQPMLAELPQGSRIQDAIDAAGGLTKKADLTNVNRAQLLTDGEKVYIPRKGESSGGSAAGAGGGSGSGAAASGGMAANAAGISGGKININTADEVLLQQITGVGPVTARKIVDYRDQNGQFSAIEELKNVSGIGDKTFEKMRDDVTI